MKEEKADAQTAASQRRGAAGVGGDENSPGGQPHQAPGTATFSWLGVRKRKDGTRN